MDELASVHRQLHGLLQRLLHIGSDDPELLMFLSAVVASDVAEDARFVLLTQMFEEVPGLLDTVAGSRAQWEAVLTDPPADAVTLRLFLEFRELSALFGSLTVVQLLHFTNNLLPPGPPEHQLQFFVELQALLIRWGPQQLAAHHAALQQTALLHERTALLERAPDTPVQLLHLLVELLKLPLHELDAVRAWCEDTPQSRIVYLVRLLQEEPAVVLAVKQALAEPDADAADDAHADTAPMPTDMPFDDDDSPNFEPSAPPRLISTHARAASSSSRAAPPAISSEQVSSIGGDPNGVQIEIATQPPVETVYNRLLKPYPAVAITGAPHVNGLFVEAACVGSDTMVDIALCLAGVTRVKLTPTAHAQFKKLKLAFTTQQQGTDFRLRFTLQEYQESGFVDVPGVTVYSRAITVFSHTQYLTRNNNSNSSGARRSGPAISELIPKHGPPGSKLCILGAGFARGTKLRVRIGEHSVVPQFHESGTLVCVIPPCNETRVNVAVSNNGSAWSESTNFTLTR